MRILFLLQDLRNVSVVVLAEHGCPLPAGLLMLSVLATDGALQTASQIGVSSLIDFLCDDQSCKWGSQTLGCMECICGQRDRVSKAHTTKPHW